MPKGFSRAKKSKRIKISCEETSLLNWPATIGCFVVFVFLYELWAAPNWKLEENEFKVTDAGVNEIKHEEWLFRIPNDVKLEDRWRYSSKDLFWSKNDTLFRKFVHYNKTLSFPPK